MLHELVYISRASGHWVTEAALDGLLAVSRERNRRLCVTGLLLYEDGEFVQLLEGGEQAVRALYHETIARDPRHARPLLCWENAKPERSFAGWQMGFARGRDLPAPGLQGEAAPPEGYLACGLDLSGPRSTGRDMLLAVYGKMKGA